MDKTVLVFPGQGSQYIGMTKTICEEFPYAREIYQEANDVLGYDLEKICMHGRIAQLNDVEHVFLAILTASMVVYRVFERETGISPMFVAGHSLGEYSALVASGALTFRDGLILVRNRSIYAKDKIEAGRLTVVEGLEKADVDLALTDPLMPPGIVGIGCINSRLQCVLSGDHHALDVAEANLRERGAQVTPLFGSPPFHCPHMSAAAERLRADLEAITIHKPRCPIIQNASALPTSNAETIKNNLLLQMTQTVQWRDILKYLDQKNVTTLIEIGPRATLTNFVVTEELQWRTISFGQMDDRDQLMQEISATNTKKGGIGIFLPRCLAAAVSVKNYNDDNDAYVQGVEIPYRQIESIADELEADNTLPDDTQMRLALDMLQSVFITKGTPKPEQEWWFNSILEQTRTKELFSNDVAAMLKK